VVMVHSMTGKKRSQTSLHFIPPWQAGV